MSQTVNGVTIHYVLDQATGLTQVLSDGTNTYLYGNERIAQYNNDDSAYFLTDALDSVRQLVDSSGMVTLAYEPYGEVLNSAGSGSSSYGFTGEATNGNRSQQFATFNFVLEGVWPDPQITGLLTNPNEHTGIFQGSDGRVKIVYGQSFTGTIQLSVSTGTSDGLITSEEMISIEFPNLSGEEPGYSIDLGNPGPSGTFTTGTYSYTYSIPANATFSGPYQVILTTAGDKEYSAEFDLVRDLAPEIVGITLDNSNLSESYVVNDVLYHGVPSTGALTLSVEVEDPEASHGYSQVSVTMPSGQSDTEVPY